MRRESVGELIFWGAGALAFALYRLTVPEGLPWNDSVPLALAWAGETLPFPSMPHPIWGYFVRMFEGDFILLSSVAAAVAGGLLGAIANRYLGWRVGTAAALVWATTPWVWNGAVTGERGISLAAAAVVAAWTLNAVALLVTRRARATRMEDASGSFLSGYDGNEKRGRVNRIASWTILGAASLFAIVSASRHDYRRGEAASVYARGVVAESAGRIIVMNGLCDAQVVSELEKRGGVGDVVRARAMSQTPMLNSHFSAIALRNDEIYRKGLIDWAKFAFPSETNLWVAAQIGARPFAAAAIERFPERFHTMNGKTTTPEQWAVRWAEMAPYLKSGDPFVPAMRRAFAFEGNALGNALQELGRQKEAWGIYVRVFTEVEPNNLAAAVNMSEMLRRGQKADASVRTSVERSLAAFAKDISNKRMFRRAMTRVAASGPVMRDRKVLDEMRGRIAKRREELERQGVKHELPAELKSLVEWNNEMLKAHDEHDIEKAAHIARAILSKSEWRTFVPANAVMGTAMAVKGDYVASERFYRVALGGGEGKSALPVVMNDYADTLRHLGRFDEAETYARRAVEKSGGTVWLFRLTLAEVLRDAGKNPDEVKSLVDGVLRVAPREMHARIRKEFGR